MIANTLTRFNQMFSHPDAAKLLLRLTVGGLMLFHGWHKLHAGVGGIQGMLVAHGLPAFIGYGVLLGEVVAPLLLIFGILCRLSALTVIGTMVVAWLLADLGNTFSLTPVGAWALEEIALYALASAAILLQGCGKYSVLKNSAWR
ncbi:DoxX family protein [Erwinia sorbitola]|uniref:DoxX family membrane protein n=1 Tax=Erwinia sorbitola TaxID=2681984 RepID=A0A6I6EIQ6_9GAMM|nr:DoxX family protein [Erwinia sorbitola]MTD27676.1 DoxX family membrane protein [Erwinia sorbitola]QGU89614.1 DoxX family membrane protein [Erwinia sorbitola]